MPNQSPNKVRGRTTAELAARHLLFVYDQWGDPPGDIHAVLVDNPDRTQAWLYKAALCHEGPQPGSGDSGWAQLDGAAGRPLLASMPLSRFCGDCLERLWYERDTF